MRSALLWPWQSMRPNRMQLAIFLQCEFVAPHGFKLWLALEALAGGNIAFANREVHGGVECAHLELNGADFADLRAVSARPVRAAMWDIASSDPAL